MEKLYYSKFVGKKYIKVFYTQEEVHSLCNDIKKKNTEQFIQWFNGIVCHELPLEASNYCLKRCKDINKKQS